jgi:manganese/zinc/iron transport system substrate-binding protein
MAKTIVSHAPRRSSPWLAMAALACAVGWSSLAARAEEGEKPVVVCTTTMIHDLARQIAGDRVEVAGIMKTGEDPHVYDVRPRDVQSIASADLVLANGLHLEATLGDIIANNAKGKVVMLAETPLIVPLESENARGAPDPHCWFNVMYFRIYAERTRDALIDIDPAGAGHYRTRADAYVKELESLHEWVKNEIASVPREQRVMVTSHDAFQYFGRTYFIDVYAVIGISTEQQPRPQDIARLESLVRERGVKALFIETSVSQTLNNIVEKIADSTRVKIGGSLFSDSLGEPGTPAGTYIGMVRHNVKTVVDALK